jgi:long-chain acyl-CoA synthetase
MSLAVSHDMNQKTNNPKFSLVVDGNTLPEAFLRRAELAKNEISFRFKRNGEWQELTWGAYFNQVLRIYRGIKSYGLKANDKVAIISQTRPEWLLTDVAIMGGGMATVPIYQSNTPEDIAFIIQNSESKLVFVEDEATGKKIKEAFALNKAKIPVVCFTDSSPLLNEIGATSWNQFLGKEADMSQEEEFRQQISKVSPKSIASILYTSGTTGTPKGVVLLHEAFATVLRSVTDIKVSSSDSTMTFLPQAHILGRIETLAPIFLGFSINFGEGVSTVPQDILETKPSLLISVPRIYEKIYAKIMSEVESGSPTKLKIFQWAVRVGREYVSNLSEKRSNPIALQLKYQLAYQLVFKKIYDKLGGRINFTISGGAPLAKELCEFFHACGIKVLEGYGLTETTGPIVVNRPDNYRIGTVGIPLAGTEIKIAADGEILCRGPAIAKEYYKNPEANQESYKDGWFCTGDIGEIDDKGFLKITDRKKELIKTSGGKYVAPQKLENLLKGSQWISNAMAYGDNQKYITALITLNEAIFKDWAKKNEVPNASIAELSKNEKVIKIIDNEVKTINSQLASYESIKKFALLPNDFTIESGELTPSLKIKRKICAAKYKEYIDRLY